MTANHRGVVAIDGPAAAGKTTVAEALARDLGAILFDTGTLYRAVTLAGIRSGLRADDEAAIARLANTCRIEVTLPTVTDGRMYDVYLADEDVTWAIRDAAVDTNVSAVSAHGSVREALLPVQRAIADGGRIVMVGRDIGTTVVPDAGVKLFLRASVGERARRRLADLERRGIDLDLASVEADLQRRDAFDEGRANSPLQAADDAVHVDTDGKSVENVVAEAATIVREKWRSLGLLEHQELAMARAHQHAAGNAS